MKIFIAILLTIVFFTIPYFIGKKWFKNEDKLLQYVSAMLAIWLTFGVLLFICGIFFLMYTLIK